MPKAPPWTVEEIAAITSPNLAHGDLRAIARRLGRSYKGLVQKRVVLGKTHRSPDWRPEEDAFIDAAAEAGVPVARAARLLMRSPEHALARLRARRARAHG